MEITYIGHSCFKVKGKTATLVIDPFDAKIGLKMPKLKCDVLLNTHDHFDHTNNDACSDYKLLINSPGEYEVNDVYIQGFKTFHDDKQGEERGINTIYLIDIDGFSILHLGDLGHELDKSLLEKLPDIHVLMIPVGGFYTISASQAVKVISSIDPHMIVPMHYKVQGSTLDDLDTLDKFLDEMGVENTVQKLDKLTLTTKADFAEEQQVIVLNS